MKSNIKYQQIMFPIITLIIGFILSPFKSYIDKDFEDLATKKNITEITKKIEDIKSKYISQNDSLRVELSRESEAISKRREVYTKIARSARVFIQQNYIKDLEKEFLANYSEIWLWASDSVIIKLNNFIDHELLLSAGKIKKNDAKQKRLYSAFLMALRKDVGFEMTKLKPEDFRYFYF